MAEAVLFNVAGRILATLGSQVLQEIGLLWGVKDELEKLKCTVSTIQAVLLDAEEQYVASHQVRDWLRQLKEALYGADNLLDDFSTRALRRRVMTGNKVAKEVRLLFSSSNQLVYGLKMAHRIKDMRTRLDYIAASRKFHLVERPLERLVMHKDREQTHSYPPEIVVGREEDKEAIIELLMSSSEENLGTVPIVGIGGLGKTTLAQLVFNDEKVKSLFNMRLWVCVADNFDIKLIVEKILGFETRGTSREAEMNCLVDQLHEKIHGKKYLLVLDDVWNENTSKWFTLKDLLNGGASGSRIIVTTRLSKVGQITRPIKVHELQGLSSDESWRLFSQMAFQKGQVPSESHKRIGEEIVAKCLGVPLVIKAIGGLLYFKTTISEWASFRSKELLSLGEGESNIWSILKISYDHLPSHLKHCFAYCCIFPKDHIIDVPKLVNLWMAQDYVNRLNPSRCLEDVGFEYFMDLLWRSFFQEVEKDIWGNIESCKMHDLMHDLAMQVAGPDIKVSGPKGQLVGKKTRHVSFHFDPYSPWKVPVSLLEADDVRTFLLLSESFGEFRIGSTMEETQMDVISSKLRYLRSLDLHFSAINKVPHSVSKLKHLRYLDFSFNEHLTVLPDSVTKLYNLQVLKLEGCGGLVQLPKDINHLINLSQLDLWQCNKLTHIPRGLGQLTSLHTLTKFVVARDAYASKHAGGLDELRDMNNLHGQLQIADLTNVAFDTEEANLKEKEHLQRLVLDWNREVEEESAMEDDGWVLKELEPHPNLKVLKVGWNRGLKFPRWMSFLTNLVEIRIFRCRYCRYVPPLHQLPCLRILAITSLAALEYMDSEDRSDNARLHSTSIMAPSPFFPSLEVLSVEGCTNLKGWWRRPPTTAVECLPRLHLLSKLRITDCPHLTLMPLFPPLQSLTFRGGNLESFEDILKTMAVGEEMASSRAASSLAVAFSQLQELAIEDIEDLELLPDYLAQNMGSLKTLTVSGCHRFRSLGQAVGHLTSLESLILGWCDDLNLSEDDSDDQVMQWQSLGCLHSLYLKGIPKLVSLPKWIQHIPNLHELKFWHCDNLVALPDWMVHLNSLQRLVIYYCEYLSERCRSRHCDDWPRIAHIPNIRVDEIVVQRNGRYLVGP